MGRDGTGREVEGRWTTGTTSKVFHNTKPVTDETCLWSMRKCHALLRSRRTEKPLKTQKKRFTQSHTNTLKVKS